MNDNKIKNKKHNEKNIENIEISKIRPNPYQPRKQFNMGTLNDLCRSIKEYGILQPINVRKAKGGKYELIAGERRLRAAAMAGLNQIPCIVACVDENDSAMIALIENLQRENLSYIEEAEGYSHLLNEHRMTQDKLAKKLGKSQSTIANKLRLLKLAPDVKKVLFDNNLTERHARALLKLPDYKKQLKVLKVVCEKGLNVKKTEEQVEMMLRNESCSYYEKERMNHRNEIIRKKVIRDIRIFINTVKNAIDIMKASGIRVKSAQFDRGEYIEFIIRVPKKQENSEQLNKKILHMSH